MFIVINTIMWYTGGPLVVCKSDRHQPVVFQTDISRAIRSFSLPSRVPVLSSGNLFVPVSHLLSPLSADGCDEHCWHNSHINVPRCLRLMWGDSNIKFCLWNFSVIMYINVFSIPPSLFPPQRSNTMDSPATSSSPGPFLRGSISSFRKLSNFFGEEPPRVEDLESFLERLGYSHLTQVGGNECDWSCDWSCD